MAHLQYSTSTVAVVIIISKVFNTATSTVVVIIVSKVLNTATSTAVVIIVSKVLNTATSTAVVIIVSKVLNTAHLQWWRSPSSARSTSSKRCPQQFQRHSSSSSRAPSGNVPCETGVGKWEEAPKPSLVLGSQRGLPTKIGRQMEATILLQLRCKSEGRTVLLAVWYIYNSPGRKNHWTWSALTVSADSVRVLDREQRMSSGSSWIQQGLQRSTSTVCWSSSSVWPSTQHIYSGGCHHGQQGLQHSTSTVGPFPTPLLFVSCGAPKKMPCKNFTAYCTRARLSNMWNDV